MNTKVECIGTFRNVVSRHVTPWLLGSCVCLSAQASASTLSFAPPVTFATPPVPYAVTTADINGDGKPDLITANYNITAEGAAVLLNTTATNAAIPSFAGWQAFATQQNPVFATTADINADGKPDVVVANSTGGVVSVLLNTTATGAGNPSLAGQQFYSVGPSGQENPYSVATADINGDSKPDMITADLNAGTMAVLINTTAALAATSTFASSVAFLTGTGTTTTKPRSVAAADINGDNKPDVIVANRDENTFSVFLNTTTVGAATPTFAAQQIFATGIRPVNVAVADVNGDGKPDLVIANSTDNTISVRLNTTSPGAAAATFSAQQIFGTGAFPIVIATDDVDGDGKPDLIVANLNGSSVSVLINTTSQGASIPSFAAQQTFSVDAVISVTTADINGDGKPDLIVANPSGSTASVLLNTTLPDRIFANGFE